MLFFLGGGGWFGGHYFLPMHCVLHTCCFDSPVLGIKFSTHVNALNDIQLMQLLDGSSHYWVQGVIFEKNIK